MLNLHFFVLFTHCNDSNGRRFTKLFSRSGHKEKKISGSNQITKFNCEDKFSYQLARTIVLVGSGIGLGVQRDVGKAGLQVLRFLGERVLGDRLESDVHVDAFLG